MISDSEKIFLQISQKPGVLGSIAMKTDGIPIRTDFSDEQTNLYCALVSQFLKRTDKVLGNILDDPKLESIRIRSKKNELIIAPEGDYVLVVVQDPYVK